MIRLYTIGRIALYEAKLLFRSWGFRIFSGLGLLILTLVNIGIGTTVLPTPYFFHSLSSSLPLNSIKLFNVYQGIIAAFLATEFFKRDRKHDTNEVVFARSFSNVEYILGKVAGILGVFLILNIIVLLSTFVIHFFFSTSVFAWQPYLIFFLLLSVPTLVFFIGLSILLIHLLRSQALVFVLMLGYSFLVLVFIGPNLFYLFDSYGFYQPFIYSDFIGGNLQELLPVRGAYLLLGLAFIGISTLLSKRLRQSRLPNIGAGIVSAFCVLIALVISVTHVNGKLADREYREQLKASSKRVIGEPTVSVTTCDIHLQHNGDEITAAATLHMVNNSPTPLNSLLLSLNPGLTVHDVSTESGKLQFQRDQHLLKVILPSPLNPKDAINVSISYSGPIDERYCYLDITGEQLESRYRLWLYGIPKRYAVVSSGYLHLTPEAGWYPISGLPGGATFPSGVKRDYTKYTLSVTVPEGKTAISQGMCEIGNVDNQTIYTFRPETLLPQISLTIGDYEQHHIEVDNVIYSLYILPSHDYFSPYFNEINDKETISKLIRDIRSEYEVMLGLEYPFSQFTLVEVPIQFSTYHRLWSSAQETVQPQLVYLPEMGTILNGADFGMYTRMMQRFRGRRMIPMSPKDLQGSLFNRFVNGNFIRTRTQPSLRGFLRGTGIGSAIMENVEPQYDIFPIYVSYVTDISSSRWPVLNYALESYLQDMGPSMQSMFFRFFRGITAEEEANLLLKGESLAGLLGNPSVDPEMLIDVMRLKGRTLLALLEAKLGVQNFRERVMEFLEGHRFASISETEWMEFIGTCGDIDFPKIIDSWYNGTEIPGYQVENIETYEVIDEERKRTQVKFQVTNPTEVEGLLKVSFRYRRGFGGRFMGGGSGQDQEDFSRMLLVPGKTTKEVGMVLDQPPAMMSIDTFVSRNIPSVITAPFLRMAQKSGQQPEDKEESRPYTKPDLAAEGVYVVDNEDAGFEIPGGTKESWVQRTLRSLFGSTEERDAYKGVNIFRPPSNWTAVTFQDFYGMFVRSAYFKKSGNGQSKVVWNVELAEPGDYDIYYYYEGQMSMMRFMRRGRDRQQEGQQKHGKKHFLIYHEDGVEEVFVDLKDAEAGWNHLGTYRLVSGKNKVEMTDKNETRFVTADAIKWVKRTN